MPTKTVKSPFLSQPVACGTGKAPGKSEAAKAERVTIRYRASANQWQAVRVFNTAYYETKELDLIVKRNIKALRDQGCKGVEAHRWTPTVFNASGE